MALVSNVPLPGHHYRQVLNSYGLDQLFQIHCFSYDRGTRKPSPAMLRQALSAMGAEAGQAMMIGDRRDRDILAGELAGVTTVWLRSTELSGPEPTHTVESLAELPSLVLSGTG